MKKIILVIAVAVSLNASEVMCKLYTEKYQSSNQMAIYALQNGDKRKELKYTKETLHNIETTGAECGYSEKYMEAVEKFRVILKARIKKLNDAL